MVKQIPEFASNAKAHLYKTIVRTGKFPQIIPIRKKDKDKFKLEIVRQINNFNLL